MNEKEARENVKEQLEGIKKANECGLATKGEFNKDIEAIETVLNLLEKKDAEYSDLKLKYEQNLRMCKHFREELNKQDKMINLMCEIISAIETDIPTIKKQFEKEYCEFINSDEDCCWKTDKNCEDCIKKWIERKVESEEK